jgi:hypothetical protein
VIPHLSQAPPPGSWPPFPDNLLVVCNVLLVIAHNGLASKTLGTQRRCRCCSGSQLSTVSTHIINTIGVSQLCLSADNNNSCSDLFVVTANSA